MSVIKSNMAAIAVCYTKFWCMVTPKFYDCNPCVHVWNAYIQNILKFKSQEPSLIGRNKLMIIYQRSKPYKYISILKLMSSQVNAEAHVFPKQAWRPLIFIFYFNFIIWFCMQVIRKIKSQTQLHSYLFNVVFINGSK